jgi:hypothetical protein
MCGRLKSMAFLGFAWGFCFFYTTMVFLERIGGGRTACIIYAVARSLAKIVLSESASEYLLPGSLNDGLVGDTMFTCVGLRLATPTPRRAETPHQKKTAKWQE